MEKREIFNRIVSLLYTNGKRFCSPYFFENNKRWRELKGKYKGKRIFLIANGPSLNITPLFLLKDEYTIMFNRIKLMLERLNYIPTYYMVSDEVVAPTIKDEIMYFIDNSEKVFVPDLKKTKVDFTKFVPFNDNVFYWYEEPVKFSKRPPILGAGTTVIYRAFQVLAYMGFNEIVVVGNDMNYVVHQTAEIIENNIVKGKSMQSIKSIQDDDPNHFDPRYFGKGKEYHQPTDVVVNRIFDALDRVAIECNRMGVKVTNAGYNSRVESFPKQDFYECLGYSQEKIDSLFEDLVKEKGFATLANFLSRAKDVDYVWNEELDVAAVPLELAGIIVTKKVFQYLPLGPYNNKVFFVNRKLVRIN